MTLSTCSPPQVDRTWGIWGPIMIYPKPYSICLGGVLSTLSLGNVGAVLMYEGHAGFFVSTVVIIFVPLRLRVPGQREEGHISYRDSLGIIFQ